MIACVSHWEPIVYVRKWHPRFWFSLKILALFVVLKAISSQSGHVKYFHTLGDVVFDLEACEEP